jgi:hypothetical protein
MKSPTKKPHRRQAPQLAGVGLVSARPTPRHRLYALDEKSAGSAAIAEFKIGEDQRRCLIARAGMTDPWS